MSETAQWDQGVVRFAITDHKGRESVQEQSCWHKGRFVARQQAEAIKSQQDADETKHFSFRVLA